MFMDATDASAAGSFDVRANEKKWQKAWEDSKCFEPTPDGRRKFFITVPYPYISGSLHIGHARSAMEVDVMARFHRMNGENTLYPMAFHVSGTPVLGISLAIANGDEKLTKLYEGYVRRYVPDDAEAKKIIASFVDPQKVVDFFIPKMIEEFKSLGLSVDWRRSFTSADPMHQALVEWQFRKYKEEGCLVQGKYPILFSLSLKNAVGEDDIKDGDSDPVEVQEFCAMKFKFGEDYLIAATLRPETMYGQTNMWVNPDVDYVRARVGDETWIVSNDCAEKLSFQDKTVKMLGSVPGKSLLGKTCAAPFIEREILVLPSTHCNPSVGTGIVTSVPSDAPFDYIALKELQESKALCGKYGLMWEEVKAIPLIPIITSKSFGEFAAVEAVKKRGIGSLAQHELLEEATQEVYKAGYHTGVMNKNCGQYAGLPVAQAKESMRKKLLEAGRAFVFYETSRPAKSRDGGTVIVAVLDDQWFLDFNTKGWKEKSGECLKEMQLWPEKYRRQFETVFAWLDKRPCARRRGLGTKLPFDQKWVIESLSDSTIYMSLYPIAHKVRVAGVKKEQLNTTFFEFVMNSKGNAGDVAKSCGIGEKDLAAIRDEWRYWYPFDQRHTFPNHLSNHLSFMIFAHTAIFEKRHWPKRISFHGTILSGGEKMSKSKGNTVTLLDVTEKYGADAFRAFMCNSTSVDSDFNWESDKVEAMKRHLSGMYSLLKSAQENKRKTEEYAKFKSFVSRTEKSLKRAKTLLSEMKLKEYSNIVLYTMLAEYKKVVASTCDAGEIASINGYVAEKWVLLLAPLVPHLAEELWAAGKNQGLASVARLPDADESRIDEKLERIEDAVAGVRADILKIKEITKKENVSSVKAFVAPEWKWRALELIRKACPEKPDVGAAMKAAMADAEIRGHGAEAQTLIKAALSKFGELGYLEEYDELAVLNEAKPALEKEFGSVEVLRAEDSDEPKAKMAFPGRPALIIS